MTNIFKKANDASATGGGNYIRDGRYTWLVELLKAQDGNEGDCYIGELRVIEAEQDPDHPEVKPNPVGTTVSFVYNVTKQDAAAGNIKAFCIGLLGGLGFQPEQVDEQAMTDTVHKSNPMRGAMIKGATYRKTIKSGANMGKPITLVKWESVEQSADDIKTGRTYLDKKAAAPVQAPKPSEPVQSVTVQNIVEQPKPAPAAEPPKAKASKLLAALGE